MLINELTIAISKCCRLKQDIEPIKAIIEKIISIIVQPELLKSIFSIFPVSFSNIIVLSYLKKGEIGAFSPFLRYIDSLVAQIFTNVSFLAVI